MSQVGSISNANPNTTNITNDNKIKNNDDSFESIIDAGLKKDFENETSMEKMEKLGGPRPPKPESTMHKVGRFLTGILGGLLLAAGIAAAVAATVASCGLAVGVVAGVAATVVGAVGVTGASVIAGAAGATGIGLIAGSHAMKPKNPEALLQTQQPAEKSVPLTKMGGDEVETIAEALKTNHGIDVEVFNDANKYLVQNSMNANMTYLLRSIDTNGGYNYGTVSSRGARENVIQFVSSALTLFGIDTEKTQASPKNALMVRYAIDNYLLNQASTMTDEQLELLNNGEVKKDLIEMINDELKHMPAQTENYHMLAIFRDALNLESVPKPQQNPVIQNDLGINLISNPEEKTVSLGNKNPNISKILPKNISFTEEAEKPIVDALSAFGEWNNSLTDDCRDYISLLFSNTEKNKNGTIKSLDEGIINKFVKSVLDANDTEKIELNAKNVLLVRYNIITYFEQDEGQYKDIYNDLNSPEGRKPYVDYLQNALKTETDPDTVTGIRIFIAALTETDLSKLDANLIPPQDIKA